MHNDASLCNLPSLPIICYSVIGEGRLRYWEAGTASIFSFPPYCFASVLKGCQSLLVPLISLHVQMGSRYFGANSTGASSA